MTDATHFQTRILRWFDEHGRHDLPWQRDITPYRVWVSEIMLQQTQVATVIPYFMRFMESFPTVEALASASEDSVLHHWTGLGYYARARNLHAAAKTVVAEHGGEFPRDVAALTSLKGIGRSTAGAIASIAMGLHAPILDGNVKRVLARFHAIPGWPEQTSVRNELWEIANSLTPHERTADYTQAMMDLGATLCIRSKPRCQDCPLVSDCAAYRRGLSGEIPGKKPRKSLPIKSAAFLILISDESEVLLEKRPPNGIWGSLYSFPEGPDPDRLPVIPCAAVDADSVERRATLRHTFSHFHLEITPIIARATPKAGVAEGGRWLWYPLDGSREVGLAAPVKKLLATLA